MPKYHVNPETGRVNICRAKIRCDFTIDNTEPPHFYKKEEAQKSAENMLEQKYNTLSKIDKTREEGKVHLADLLDKDHLDKNFTEDNYRQGIQHLNKNIKLVEKSINVSENYLEKSRQKTLTYNYSEVAQRRKGLKNSKEKLYYMKRNKAILLKNQNEYLDRQDELSDSL